MLEMKMRFYKALETTSQCILRKSTDKFMKKIVYTLLITLSLTPLFAYAQDAGQYTLLEPLPCIDGVSTNCNADNMQTSIDISSYLLYVYKFGLAISVFLAIIMIIWGGFEYILSAAPFGKSNGKGKIEKAVFGLVMVLVSYLILQTIDPRLVYVDSRLPVIQVNIAQIEENNDSFQRRLSEELKLVNIENQARFREINTDIQSLEQRKIELNQKISSGEITPDEAQTIRSQIEAEMVTRQIDRQVLIAVNDGISSYSKAISNINSSGIDSPNLNQYIAPFVPNGTDYPINTLNTIQNQYNLRIRELKKNNAGALMIPVLERQSEFIFNQAKDSVEIYNKINETSWFKDVDNSDYLKQKVVEYEARIADSKSGAEFVGIPEKQYRDIFEAKVNTVKQALEITP